MAFRNESRGLTIAGTGFRYLTEGAYGIIFFDPEQHRIRKVYRCRHDADTAHCEQVFNAETEAYRVANKTPELRELVPQFFSECPRGTIIDKHGIDQSAELLPLAFEAEFIPGEFQKWLGASAAERARLAALFQRCGIRHFIDASLRIEDGKIVKVIDFAMEEIELFHRGP